MKNYKQTVRKITARSQPGSCAASGTCLVLAIHVRVHALSMPLLIRNVRGGAHEGLPYAFATHALLNDHVEHKGALCRRPVSGISAGSK